MSNVISYSSNHLHPAAARLEHYTDQLDDARNEQLKFANWCQQKAETCQFLYWATVLQVELKVLCTCAVCTKRRLPCTWMPSENWQCGSMPWITPTMGAASLQDMVELTTTHPEIAKEFQAGNFVVQETNRPFSTIPVDQAHEPNNAAIKGDGGAVGLTDNLDDGDGGRTRGRQAHRRVSRCN